MTLLIAGHETTAAVLTWTVFSLTEHPEVVTRLQQEVLVFSYMIRSVCFMKCKYVDFAVHQSVIVMWADTQFTSAYDIGLVYSLVDMSS